MPAGPFVVVGEQEAAVPDYSTACQAYSAACLMERWPTGIRLAPQLLLEMCQVGRELRHDTFQRLANAVQVKGPVRVPVIGAAAPV
jgi:hypothetical protein